METSRFLFKFRGDGSTVRLGGAGPARPGAAGRTGALLGAAGVRAGSYPRGESRWNSWALPSGQWLPSLVGSNAFECLTLIPLLGIGPAGRHARGPQGRRRRTRPALAGAVAGIAAGGRWRRSSTLHSAPTIRRFSWRPGTAWRSCCWRSSVRSAAATSCAGRDEPPASSHNFTLPAKRRNACRLVCSHDGHRTARTKEQTDERIRSGQRQPGPAQIPPL